jgi:hypothetical protein
VEEFMVQKLLLLLKWLQRRLVDASKSNGPLLSAGAMQLEEGSFRTKGIKLKTNYIFSI